MAGVAHEPGMVEPINFNGCGSCSGARFLKLLSFDSGSGAGHFPFMALTSDPFDLNFAGSGSAPAPAPAPLRTKICYKGLIFVYRKSISITAKQNNYLFSLQDIKNHYFYKIFKNCWSLEPHYFMPAPTPTPAPFQFLKVLRFPLRLLKEKYSSSGQIMRLRLRISSPARNQRALSPAANACSCNSSLGQQERFELCVLKLFMFIPGWLKITRVTCIQFHLFLNIVQNKLNVVFIFFFFYSVILI